MRKLDVISGEEADDFFGSALALHGHFYKPWVPYKNHAADLHLAQLFINRIIALASDGDIN